MLILLSVAQGLPQPTVPDKLLCPRRNVSVH